MSRTTTRSTGIMTERAAQRALAQYTDAVALGEAVRYCREQIGVSQGELATYAGLSQATVSRIEHGRRAIRPHERAAISRALGVSLATLTVNRSAA